MTSSLTGLRSVSVLGPLNDCSRSAFEIRLYVAVYCPLLPSVCDRMVAVSSKYALILANQGVVVRDSEIVPVSDSEIVPVSD